MKHLKKTMKNGMSWIKKLYAPILTITISSLLGITIVEVTLRIIYSDDQWSKTKEANIIRNQEFSYDIRQLYESDTSFIKYVRNQYGLRDNCTNLSEVDILTIGGSTTDQRYVPLTSSYQVVMQERLKKFNNNFGCVSNAGVDGHSSWGHLYSFKNWFPLLPELKPKIILLYIGINDADFHRAASPNDSDDIHSDFGLKNFLKSLNIFQKLLPIYNFFKELSNPPFAKHIQKRYTDDDYKVNVINEQTYLLSEKNAIAFRSRMRTILNEIELLGAKPLCVTQPHRFTMKKEGVVFGIKDVLGKGFSGIDYDYSIQKLNEVIFELCGKNTIDLYNHEFSNSHFYDGVHTTAQGSEEIGNVIAEFIISESGFIERYSND